MTEEERKEHQERCRAKLSKESTERKKKQGQNRKKNRKKNRLKREMSRDSEYHERMCDNDGKGKLRFGKSNMAGKGRKIPNTRKRR